MLIYLLFVFLDSPCNEHLFQFVHQSFYQNRDVSLAAYHEVANNDRAKINFQKSWFVKNQKVLNFDFINTIDFFCSSDKCTILSNKNESLYFDDTHITEAGARHIALKIKSENYFPKDFYTIEK